MIILRGRGIDFMTVSRGYWWMLMYYRSTRMIGAHGIGLGSESRALDFAHENSPNDADSFDLEGYAGKEVGSMRVRKIHRKIRY
jgi:hypothetical protein